MNISKQIHELYFSKTDRLGDKVVISIGKAFNFLSKFDVPNKGWLHIGPVGIITDEYWTINFKPYKRQEGLLSTEQYQLVQYRKDNGEPLPDTNSSTGVYEGQRAIVGGGSMLPVEDPDRATEIIELMKKRINKAHSVHI